MTSTGSDLDQLLRAHTGGPYGFGAKWNPSDPTPVGPVDCSGFVRWGVVRLGVTDFPDGSWNQLAYCRQHGTVISVDQAQHTRGALLFVGANGEHHIAQSRGDITTIEARGVAYGVGSWTAAVPPRAWSVAALVPGLDYGAVAPPPVAPDPQPVVVGRGTMKGKPVAKMLIPIKTDSLGRGSREAPPGYLGVFSAGSHDVYDPNTQDKDSIVVPIGERVFGDGFRLVIANGPADTWVSAPVLVSD